MKSPKWFLFFFTCLFYVTFSFENVQAQTEFVQECADKEGLTSTESLLGCFNVDLPDAFVTCRAGGILSEIFKKTIKLKAGGNAFFIDEVTKEVALFEKSVFKNQSGKENSLDIFIQIPNLSRENIVDLLVRKNLVSSKNARVIFALKINTNNGRETFLYDIKGEGGSGSLSTIFTRVKKIRSVTIDGKKLFTADGFIKINFPGPPKKLDSNGNLIDTFSNLPGSITCSCNDCPLLHNFDLLNLNNAFDKDIVDDIKKEATSLIE